MKRGRHVWLFSDPSPAHSLYSTNTSGDQLLLLQLVNGVMDDDGMRNALRGSVGLLLYLQRSVPAINKYGNMDNRLLEDRNELPAKSQSECLPCGVG